MRKKQILYYRQFGFWKDFLTNHANLTLPFESIQKALEDGQFACRIFIDLGSHDILIEKLNHYAAVLKQKDIKLHFKEIPFFAKKYENMF